MTLEEFVAHYPFVYHMAEPNTWESIRALGLLSTSALLDLCGSVGEERRRIESQHRPKSVQLACGKYGAILIRDQKPMSDVALRKCLTSGMTPAEWYATLNRKVFFWVTEKRLNKMLGAYRGCEHIVLVVDSSKLLNRPSLSITLSPINSGSARRKAAPRGRETFRSLQDYPFDERRKRRGLSNAVRHVAIEWGIRELAGKRKHQTFIEKTLRNILAAFGHVHTRKRLDLGSDAASYQVVITQQRHPVLRIPIKCRCQRPRGVALTTE